MSNFKGYAKLKAEQLFNCIPKGHRNPLKRPMGSAVDRALRILINIANVTGIACIINVGNGYYHVDKNDIVDLKEFKEYIAKEKSRAYDILRKCKAMENYLDMQDQIEFMEWFNGGHYDL